LAGEERLRWLVRHGRLRAVWRLLLFALLVLVLLQVQVLLLAVVFDLPGVDRLPEALLVQAVLMLLAAVLAGWAMLRAIDRRPLRDLGFALDRQVPRDLAAGVSIGAAGMVIVVLLLALAGAYRFTTAPGSLPEWAAVMGAALLFFALPAAAEEALFRGYPFRTLLEAIGPVGATLIMSALFALVHGANPHVDAWGYANIFAAGVMLSLAVLWTGSLWFASAVHLGWNWATAALLDLPVSGLDLFDAPLYDGLPEGPAWLTGGMFGPEGGVAGTLAVLAVVALLWWYARPGSRGYRDDGKRDDDVQDR
jgi:uncharacterized protein